MKPYSYYQLLSRSDKNLFESELKAVGFTFHENYTPASISGEISEDVNDGPELPPELDAIKQLAQALGFIVSYNIDESAPAGWGKTVEAMKKHKEIDNPFALANWMKKRGLHPHKGQKKK